ncbi:MAG: hypothetical protein KAG97_11855, partial [Victivallales bacterium]|nr:hypothetical protein [Victivallales bacterium]
GVAERILLTKENVAAEKTFHHFPFHSDFDEYSLLEQRRPDCNFQPALLFLLAGDYFNDREIRGTGEGILRFLYDRSGLLNKVNKRYEADTWPTGVWGWTHGSFYNTLFFFDDNAWNLLIQLIIAEKYPELERKYEILKWSEALAEKMADAFEDQFLKEPTAEHAWSGELDSPHWGSLVCMALAAANAKFANPRYSRIIDTYHDYILEKTDAFSTSEYAYIVIGACFAARFADPKHREIAARFADKLMETADEDGILPSQWNEAPEGEKLVDLIYTMNWSLLAFQLVADLTGEERYREILEKQLSLIIDIQDDSPEPHLNGCWRGMYDAQSKAWAGGNCFEGGSDSIYTGWTNAPIALALVSELSSRTILDLM